MRMLIFFTTLFTTLGCLLVVPKGHSDQQVGQEIFQQKCISCHSIGGGKKVGPDLLGVYSRRQENWLRRQIKEPNQLVAEGDPIAAQLVKEANGVIMPPLGLNEDEVAAMISYLKSVDQQNGQQRKVSIGVPANYVPTVVISLVVVAGITVFGFRAGKKNI